VRYRIDHVQQLHVQPARKRPRKQTNSFLDPVLNDGLNRQYKITAVIKP
jgi:hypothetical protein